MGLLTTIPVLLVGILHVYIFVLEAFLWTTPKGMKTFGLSPTFAAQTRSLAANQGLYNGFLAAGLFWGAFHPVIEFGRQVQLFFCACVFVAGVVGGATAKPKIFFVQGIPGLVALVTVLLF
jgi:putative membrane protein